MLDGSEYKERIARPFTPPVITFSELNTAVPHELRTKSLTWALCFVARDVIFSIIFYSLATYIDTFVSPPIRWGLWGLYWFWQSIAWTGLWILAHEAGHGNISDDGRTNSVLGFLLHTFLFIPYFAWRHTHMVHHKYTNSQERDENYVPYTRSDVNLPEEHVATSTDYAELLEDAPFYILCRLFVMQLAGLQHYLMFNTRGSKAYPSGTNHFSPSSPLFRRQDSLLIVVSNIGLVCMASVLAYCVYEFGLQSVVKFYFVPYVLVNHWIVMLTYLHHSDPTIPHYRAGEWNWLRGALATVDRPLLGWIGRFFLHNISHDHVAHHLFPDVPFYNTPRVTEVIKPLLKTHYNYDSTNTFYALYRSFAQCYFVEDHGGILFYRNQRGKALRAVAS